MMITKLSLPRRTFLRGMGATLALPLLDAMVPALTATSRTPANPARRLGCIYVGNGAVMDQWTPAAIGSQFELTPILAPLAPLRDRVLILTGLDHSQAMAQNDSGGEHSRAGAGFLSAAHAKQTEGADMRAGTTIDQIAAGELGKDTQLASLELALDAIDMVGNCDNGYSCAYLNTISWRTPTTPLPMEVSPRAVFERLFGTGDTTVERLARSRENRSILDVVTRQASRLQKTLGPRDSAKLTEYFDAIRDVERRIQKVEQQNSTLPVPSRPAGVPGTFKDHAKLMFDMQLLAFQADITRVITFMLARELTTRTYEEIGVPDSHHSISHHAGNPEKLASYAKINTYHIQTFAEFLETLRSTPDGDGSLLDHSLFLYASGIRDGNNHGHLNVPVLVAGGVDQLRGGRHVRYKEGTPIANLLLSLLDRVGVPVDKLGDSTGPLGNLADM